MLWVNFLVSALNWVWPAATKVNLVEKGEKGKGFAMNLQVSRQITHTRNELCQNVSFFNLVFVYYFEPSLLALGMPMATRARATVRLKFASGKQLKTLLNSLMPETKTSVARRANVKLEKIGSYLLLTVEAEDTIALRSTLNAYLRWIGSAMNVIEIIRQE